MTMTAIDCERLLDRWQRYVAIESGSHDRNGLQRMAAVIASDLEEAGLRVAQAGETAAGAAHLVADRSGSAARRILLLGHTDTVWPAGTLDTMRFRVEDGHAYGPGVADMKGGLAVMVEALVASRGRGGPAVRVVITADEELGTPTGRAIVEREASGCDWALVFEAGRPGGHFVDRRRGIAVYRMIVHGKTAHAGNDPENGVNAIDELAHQLIALAGLRNPERGVYVMAGVIEGGTARQVVPDLATALIDVRGGTRVELDRVEKAVESLAGDGHIAGAKVVVEGGETRPPFEPVDGAEELRAAVRAACALRGLEASFVSAGGGSDGNFTAAAGIPTVDSMGPVGHRLCSREEHAEVETACDRAAVATHLLSS